MENVIVSSNAENNLFPEFDRELGTVGVKKLYRKYTLAALIGMGIQMASVIADGIFVGNGVGSVGLATISIIVPFWTLFVALSSLIGIGATSIAAINLGKGDLEEARSYFAQGFWYSMILSAVISILVILNLDSVVRFLGASGDVIANAKNYVFIFMLGFPFTVTGIVLYYFVRVDEKPALGAIALSIPTFLSITSEYIFIFKMHLGMVGSSIAWLICVAPSYLLLLYFIFSKSVFKVKFSDIKLDLRKINEINKVGFASFIIQIATTVVTILVNNLLGIYGGELDIASYGIINAYILYILNTLLTGFIIGMQPIASYNCGASAFARVREVIITSIKYTFISLAVILILIFTFANQILGFFTGGFQPLIDLAKHNMYIFTFLFPLGCISMIASGYFQAIEHNGKAIFNGITRIFIFAVPLVYLFSKLMGLKGIWMAQPVADFLAFLVAIYFIYRELKRLKELQNDAIHP